jgi:hypothetical protein
MSTNRVTAQPVHRSRGADGKAATDRVPLTSSTVWQALEKASFAVVSHVNAAGEPRSSGVVYGVVDHRLYMAVASDGWKARQIANDQEVALTVPVRRGGILSLLVPIPPATITFRATATVHPAGSLDVTSVSKDLAKLVPDERKDSSVIIELVPKGRFLTYGIGVSLMDMRDPRLARASVPVFS